MCYLEQVISLLSSVTEEEKLYFTGFQSCKNPLVECLLMWAAVIIVSKQQKSNVHPHVPQNTFIQVILCMLSLGPCHGCQRVTLQDRNQYKV